MLHIPDRIRSGFVTWSSVCLRLRHGHDCGTVTLWVNNHYAPLGLHDLHLAALEQMRQANLNTALAH